MTIRNLVVISDTHIGDGLALCPPRCVLDDGGEYRQSELQRELWRRWNHFWNKFVPDATHGEPFSVVHNGDAIDGSHHNATTQITQNLTTQADIAYDVLKPVVARCDGRYYHIRGTEAHVGKSGREEEALARRLGAVPNKQGQHARYELRIRIGGGMVHLLHHIGTTSSSAHEASAINAEIAASFVEAARWNYDAPHVVVRSHRHRYMEVRFATARGLATSVVTPGWQCKTPFVWKIAGGRQAPAQIGGVVIRWAHGTLFVNSCVWAVKGDSIV